MAEPLPGGVLLPGEQTFQVPELKPMDPQAPAKLKARLAEEKAAADPFAGLEQVNTPAGPDEFAGLEQVQAPAAGGDEFASLEQADELDLKDQNTLFNDDNFRPADYLAQNPKVSGDKLTKLLAVYRERQKRGLEAGKVLKAAVTEAPGIVAKTAKGARDLVSRTIDLAIQPAANKLIGAVVGTTPEEQARIDAEQGKTQLKAAAEITAGTESAITGLANLATTGTRKLFGKSPDEMTEKELLDRLYVDSEFSKATKEAAEGQGDAVKAAGLDAETLAKNGVTLDKEAIENLSLVDPLTLVATGGAFKVVGLGGRVLATAATKVGAEAALTGLKSLAANSLKVAGKAIETGARVSGTLAEKVPAKSLGFALGGAKTGTLTGASVGAAAGEAAKRLSVETAAALERRGAALAEAGTQLHPSFVGPKSAGLERLSTLAASPVGQVAGAAAKGAVQGAATAAPLVLAADDSQTAGALLGGGAALGAIHGTVSGGKAAIAETVAKRYLDPHQIPFEPTNSPAYGADAALDAGHERAVQQLPANDQNMVNTFREAVRSQGGEIYVQDAPDYLNRIRESLQRENGGQALTSQQEAQAQLYAKTHAFFDVNVDGKRTVFLNSTAKGLPHDAGHLFQSLLDPEVQTDLRQTVLDSYKPEQLDAFKQAYAQKIGEPDYFSKLGDEAGNAKAADELIAENFSQLFQNTRFNDLKAPRTVLQKLAQVALNSSEALGIDLKAGRTTPDLAASPSYRLQGILRNAAQEILTRAPKAEDVTPAAPAPAEPPKAAEVKPAAEATPAAPITPEEVRPVGETAPAPKPAEPTPPAAEQPGTSARNIRTTREQQNDFSSRRSEETGVAEAQKATEASPETRAIVDQIAPHVENGTVIEVEHRGIASERGPANPEGRTSRRATQAQGYEELARLQVENRQNAPADIVNEHQKTFVPVRFTTQGGKPTLIAMSLDKVISNVHRVVADAAANGVAELIPYPTEAGKLTEAGWHQAVSDIKAYAENQSNGYRGDGQKLTRPTEDIGVSLPAENPNYTPKPLSEAAMNFANLVQGLNPPETGRVQKGQTPGNVKGQLLAEVNRKQPMTPSVIKPEHVQKQGFKGFEPRQVAETNPLRNELAARGVKTRELIEVTERLNVEDIASVKPRPDIEFKAPVTDTIRAGFLPGNETDKAVRNGFIPDAKPSSPTPSPEIRTLASNYTKSSGIDYKPSRDYAPLNPELGKELADYYEAATSAPNDPAVQASYNALKTEVMAQYKAMTDAGYSIEPWTGEGEPYKSSADAVKDIRENKHLYYLQTDKAFGQSADANTAGGPMLEDSGVVINSQRLPVNDVFRAVHDFFGHGKEGFQFGPRGEFNAWRSHAEMFSPEAQGALAAETLAQNSWVNFGKHLRNADGSIPQKGEAGYIPPQNRPFGEQKNIVIPESLIQRARTIASDRSFLPDGQSVEEFGRKLLDASPEQFKPAMDALGGLTNGAWDLGKNLKNPGDVQVLRNLAAEASARGTAAMKAGNFTEAMPAVMKGQFFREAYEAATGTGSVKTSAEQGRLGADYKPPFPEGEGVNLKVGGKGETERLFLPASEVPEGVDPITRAAIRTEDGHIFEGAWHGEAYDNLAQAVANGTFKGKFPEGFKSLTDLLENPADGPSQSYIEDGFVTKSGKFLNRVEALDHAQRIKQLKPGAEKELGRYSRMEAGVLESDEFKGTRQFLPQTEAGKKLAKDGYDFRVTGGVGNRSVVVTKDGVAVGEIMSVQRKGGTAEVAGINLDKRDRGQGVGEAMYRELLTQLKNDGVELVGGMVVAPEPLALRRKIFGSENTKVESPEGETTPEAALAEFTVRPKNEPTFFEVQNRIPKDMQFLPKQRVDEQGRPLTKDGLIDYPKLYKQRAAEQKAREAEEAKNADAVAAKYNVPDEAKPAGDKPTGWITPDGQYVPLTTEFHEQFLAENRASLNEKFGTDFAEKASVEDRLKALNKGFVRIRQTPNGEMIVELNQKFWKDPTKTAVEESVLGRAENVDKLRLTLLNNDGQVIDTSTARLFDAEDPVAAATKALSSLKASDVVAKRGAGPTKIQQAREFGEPYGGSEPKFLPGDETLPGFEEKGGTAEEQRVVRNRVAASRDFPEAHPLEFVKNEDGSYRLTNGKPTPVVKEYDLINTPLAKEAAKGLKGPAREEAYTDALADEMVKTYNKAAKNPEIKAGEKWYSTCRTRLKKLLGNDTKIFAELLGATSARTAVDLNFKFALEAYNQWKSGAYETLLAKYREGKQNFETGHVSDYTAETGKENPTRAAYLDWWIDKHELTPLQSNGKKFGMNSRQVLKVLDGSWAAEVGGPKTPNFTGNLTGSTFEATVDVWAARMLHRLSNLGNDKKWRILPGNETGVADTDFYTGQKAFRKAAEKLNMKPDALQAILWFAEKDLWEKAGWTDKKGAEKSDFNSLLSDTERDAGGRLNIRKKSEPELDLGLGLDDIKPKK